MNVAQWLNQIFLSPSGGGNYRNVPAPGAGVQRARVRLAAEREAVLEVYKAALGMS